MMPSSMSYHGLDRLIDSVGLEASSDIAKVLCERVFLLTRLLSTSLETSLALSLAPALSEELSSRITGSVYDQQTASYIKDGQCAYLDYYPHLTLLVLGRLVV